MPRSSWASPMVAGGPAEPRSPEATDVFRSVEGTVRDGTEGSVVERRQGLRGSFNPGDKAFFIRGVAGKYLQEERDPLSAGDEVQHEAFQIISAVLGVAKGHRPGLPFFGLVGPRYALSSPYRCAAIRCWGRRGRRHRSTNRS